MSTHTEQWTRKLSEMAQASSLVDPALYTRYEVKRGLRDLNGKGVLAGLTQIGSVLAHPEGNEDGPGSLIYRGMNVNDLVAGFMGENRLGFEEICHLLLSGKLPNRSEIEGFSRMLAELRTLPEDFVHDSLLKMSSRDMMNAMSRSILALYTLDDEAEDVSIPVVMRQCLKLIAVFPLLAAYSYQACSFRHGNKSLVLHAPRPDLSTPANFLHMLRADNHYSPLEEQLLDLALVLHAEHGGGNNSSFTVHVVSSSLTDTYSTMAAAMSSLKGPRHGGANAKVVAMFDAMKRDVADWSSDRQVEEYLYKLLNKEAFDRAGLIYGMGHAVYSVSDPRTEILREQMSRLATEKGADAEMDLYLRVERLAPEVIGKVRKIYKGVSANVDFFSGFLYRLLDIPVELFTPIFAMSRIVGWSAHRIEELANGGKIIRPAYKSVCPAREYIPLADRP